MIVPVSVSGCLVCACVHCRANHVTSLLPGLNPTRPTQLQPSRVLCPTRLASRPPSLQLHSSHVSRASPQTFRCPHSLLHDRPLSIAAKIPCLSHPKSYGRRLTDRPHRVGRRQKQERPLHHAAHVVRDPLLIIPRSGPRRS